MRVTRPTLNIYTLLFGLCGMLLLPVLLVCWDYRVEFWSHPLVAPTVVLAVVSMLYMYDHLFNGMVNPIFMLATGAVGSAHFALPAVARAAATRRPMPVGIAQQPRPMPFGAPRPVSPVSPVSPRPA